MSSLDQKRSELKLITDNIFSSLEKRKCLVKQIQSLKNETKEFINFDPIQEKKIFAQFQNTLQNMSVQELLMVSLMIESHATSTPGSYPSWSSGIHVEKSDGIVTLINPILLAVTNKDLYDQLQLDAKFKALCEETKW